MLLSILDAGSVGPSAHSNAARKSLVRYTFATPDALPLLMMVGNECLSARSFRFAVGVYFEAFRLAPAEPLVSLCIGISLLCLVTSKSTTLRHQMAVRVRVAFVSARLPCVVQCEVAAVFAQILVKAACLASPFAPSYRVDGVQAFAFLANYERLRAGQASRGGPQTTASAMSEGGTSSAGSARASAAAHSTTTAQLLLDYPGVPPAADLPRSVMWAEVHYNLGRACHQLGLLHMAAWQYEQCFAAWESGGGTSLSPDLADALDIRRECAYNYALLLRHTGQGWRAFELTAKYLTL